MDRGTSNRVKGAISEFRAAIWYMEQGYQVFFPASDGGIVDFVAYKPGQRPLLIQVKTAHWITSSGCKYLQLRIGRTRLVGGVPKKDWSPDRAEDHYDELFVVYENSMWRIKKDQFPKGKKTLYFDRGSGGSGRTGYDSNAWKVH
jgi:hypothetical protein